MVRITDRVSVMGHALGSLGLALLGLTGWAAERLQGRSPIASVPARLVLTCVTAVGWVVDRLPLNDTYRRDRDGSVTARSERGRTAHALKDFLEQGR
jgi:hypothetical protein